MHSGVWIWGESIDPVSRVYSMCVYP